MKVLSLWQPWASLIACGAKSIETRGWSTPHRGPLAIHAARSREGEQYLAELQPYLPVGFPWWRELPFGAIVCVANLAKITPVEQILRVWEEHPDHPNAQREYAFGNYDRGRFGWLLKDVVALREPIECAGRQGLWEIPDSAFPAYVLEAVNANR
jgi:hypothetical protein